MEDWSSGYEWTIHRKRLTASATMSRNMRIVVAAVDVAAIVAAEVTRHNGA
jgi:hypothetical protein